MEDSLSITLEEVKDFFLAHNGKVKNSILVLHFKKYFNDPVSKTANKERFKDIVNKLAAVKTEVRMRWMGTTLVSSPFSK